MTEIEGRIVTGKAAGSGDTDSLVIMYACKTGRYAGDSQWPTIDRDISQEEGNMNIYVSNLSLDVTEEELRQEFTAFGEVVSVTIMNDTYIGSGQWRGYGFAEMLSPSEGQAAITALNGKSLRHRRLILFRPSLFPTANTRVPMLARGVVCSLAD